MALDGIRRDILKTAVRNMAMSIDRKIMGRHYTALILDDPITPEVKRKMRWPWNNRYEMEEIERLKYRVSTMEKDVNLLNSDFYGLSKNLRHYYKDNSSMSTIRERVGDLENATKPKCAKCKKIL